MTLRVGCRADDADKHGSDVTFLLYHKGKLYSAGDDGKIKAWSADLTKLSEIQAHSSSVYSLAANEDSVFSCSDEGTIKAFELGTLKEKATVVKDEQAEYWRVVYANNYLYSGDNEGNVKLWTRGTKYFGLLNTAESVKDIAVSNGILFTVKDLDVNVNELNFEGDKLHYATIQTILGRAPLTLLGDKLFTFSSREGKDILIHENNHGSHFQEVAKIQNAHDLIINALAGAQWGDKTVLFSGGWDKLIKKWIISDDIVKPDGSLDVEIVVNSIAIGDAGEIYVAGSDGHIVRIEIE